MIGQIMWVFAKNFRLCMSHFELVYSRHFVCPKTMHVAKEHTPFWTRTLSSRKLCLYLRFKQIAMNKEESGSSCRVVNPQLPGNSQCQLFTLDNVHQVQRVRVPVADDQLSLCCAGCHVPGVPQPLPQGVAAAFCLRRPRTPRHGWSPAAPQTGVAPAQPHPPHTSLFLPRPSPTDG